MADTAPHPIRERRPGRDRKLSPESELEVVKDYKAGMKLKDMEAKHGVSKPSLYAVLKRQGVERTGLRPPQPPETPYDGPDRRRA